MNDGYEVLLVVVVVVIKVATSYKKEDNINVKDESSYVVKFDSTCNCSFTMQELLQLV